MKAGPPGGVAVTKKTRGFVFLVAHTLVRLLIGRRKTSFEGPEIFPLGPPGGATHFVLRGLRFFLLLISVEILKKKRLTFIPIRYPRDIDYVTNQTVRFTVHHVLYRQYSNEKNG